MTKKSNLDDTLDVFAKEDGLIYGETNVFYAHLITIVIVSVFTKKASYLFYKFVNFIVPLRVRQKQEERGLDDSQHGELFI